MGLRRQEGVDLLQQALASGWSAQRCAVHLPELEQRWQVFLAQGLLEQQGRRWRLTDPLGMALSNQILVEINQCIYSI